MTTKRSLSVRDDLGVADEQRVQRIDSLAALTVGRANAEHQQRAAAASHFTEDWRDLSKWRTNGVSVGSGRLFGTGGVVRDIALAPGQTGIFRAEIYMSGTGGQSVLFGVSNAALGGAPPATDNNGVYIGVSGGNSSVFVGSNVSTANTGNSGTYGATAAGYYLLTIVIDPTHITFSAQSVSSNKTWIASRIPRVNLPGGTGAVNVVGVGLVGSTGAGPAGQTTMGPITGIIGDHQPPAYADQRTVGGKALWDSIKSTILFRTSSTGVRWAIRLPPNYSPAAPSPVVCFMHGATGNVMTPWDTGAADNLFDSILDPGNMILLSTDNGPTGDYDAAGRPAGTADWTELIEWVRQNYVTGPLHLMGVSGGGYQLFNLLAERKVGGIGTAIAVAAATDLQASAADPAFQSLIYNAWGASSPETLAVNAAGRDPAKQAARQYRAVPTFFAHFATDPTVNVATHTTTMKAKIDAYGAADTQEQTTGGTGHTSNVLYTTVMYAFMTKYGGASARVTTPVAQPYSDLNPPSSLLITEGPEPATPVTGTAVLYSPDGSALLMKGDDGIVRTVGPTAGSGGSGAELAATQDYTDTTPTSPTTGLKMFSRFRARRIPAFVGPTGQDSRLQPSLFSNRVGMIMGQNTTATLGYFGMPAVSTYAANTAITMAADTFYNSMVRTRFPMASTAAASLGGFRTAPHVHFSSTANKGGFYWVLRFGVAAGQTGSGNGRMLAGLFTNTAALTSADPTTLTSWCGFGYNATSTNWYFYSNDASGTSTTGVDLGANFPARTYATNFYEFAMFSPAGSGQTLYWSATRLNDGVVVQGGPVTTELPALNTLMGTQFLHMTTAAFAAGPELQSLYVESDN